MGLIINNLRSIITKLRLFHFMGVYCELWKLSLSEIQSMCRRLKKQGSENATLNQVQHLSNSFCYLDLAHLSATCLRLFALFISGLAR